MAKLQSARFIASVAILLLCPIVPQASDERVVVRVDGRAVFRVGASGDMTAPERARRIEQRMATLLGNPQASAPARVESAGANGDQRVITVAGAPVVTLTETDAQDNLTTLDALGLRTIPRHPSGAAQSSFFSATIRTSGAVVVVQEATQTADGVLDEPKASVRVRDLGQEDIVIEARFWADSRRSDFLATASNVRQSLVAALKQAGVGLPNPDVRLLMPHAPEEWQEVVGGEIFQGGSRP